MIPTLNREVAVLSRLDLQLTPAGARDILKIEFSSQDKNRMFELLEKGNCGTRTEIEDEEARELERVGHLISMLKSIARRQLNASKSK